uniref:Uncharacterized protein n=1 Tax=Panagrolaimus sp. JU765 TaxID=591449 RepID=A0AC34RDW5_9BILA
MNVPVLSDSTNIKSFKAGQTCTVVLKYNSQLEYNNRTYFCLECQTRDGMNIVCHGHSSVTTTVIKNLKKNDLIELKDVIAGECQGNAADFKIDGNSIVSLVLEKPQRQLNGILKKPTNSLTTSPSPVEEVTNGSSGLVDPNDVDKPDSFDKLKYMKEGDFCDINLKITAYICNERRNLIFINCSTSEGAVVVVVAQLHYHSGKLEKNDIVRFTHVMHNEPQKLLDKKGFYLRFEDSQAFLCRRNGLKPAFFSKFLVGVVRGGNETKQQQERKLPWHDSPETLQSSSNGTTSQVILPAAPNYNDGGSSSKFFPRKLPTTNDFSRTKVEKVAGTLTTIFQEMKYRGKAIYKANLKLDNDEEIAVVIETKACKWPLLLEAGHRVTVTGREGKFFQQKSREILHREEIDFNDLPPF